MGISERKTRDRDQRRQQILFVANRYFKANGYNEARIEDIAQGAELSSSTIYLHFKGKEDLYAAVLLKLFDRLYRRFVHVVNQDFPRLEDRLDAHARVGEAEE